MVSEVVGTPGARVGRANTRSERAVAGLPVRVLCRGEYFPGVVDDFSCSGMFVRTRADIRIGSRIAVELQVSQRRRLNLRCTVVRRSPESEDHVSDDPNWLGLCFDERQPECTPDQMQALGQLLVEVRALAIAVAELSEGSNLRGTLEKVPLPCVLSCLETAQSSGCLHVHSGEQVHVLSVHAGAIAGYESGGSGATLPLADLQAVLGSDTGEFIFGARELAERGSPSAISELLWQSTQR